MQESDSDDPFELVTSPSESTAGLFGNEFPGLRSSMSEPNSPGEDMSRSREEHLLNLFWQSYHLTIPILNEKDFRKHYNSLWTTTFSPKEAKRKPSALVDSVLALCMQYGTAFGVADRTSADTEVNDNVSLVGRGLHQRSQNLLSSEYEAPTISTLQCLIFSVLYLSNSSLLNSGRQTLEVAIGIAYKLGVQHEARDHSSGRRSSVPRRIWWTLFLLDSQMCLGFGRPYLIDASNMTCDLPSSDPLEATDFGSSLSLAFADINWLAFHTQCIKLSVTVRTIHTSFYEKCSEISSAHRGADLYDNLDLLESCADHLSRSMKGLQDWVCNVPAALKNPRKGTGEPFSTARSTIEVDPYSPLWLQRQRLLLELLYHKLAMSLHRPFIRFPSNTVSMFQTSVDRGVSCLNHAIVTTTILSQVLTEGDILNGWQPAYQYQWDAALSMLGFGLAHPVCPHAPSARRSIHTAIDNFDTLAANSCSVATSAGSVTRNLLDKIDTFASSFRSRGSSSDNSSSSFPSGPPSAKTPLTSPPLSLHPLASPHNQESDLMAMTLSSPVGFGLKNLSAPAPSDPTDYSLDMLGPFEDNSLLPYQDLMSSDLEMWSDWGQGVQEYTDFSQMNWNIDG